MTALTLRPRLIEAVKQYPNLYNTDSPDYKDLVLRDKCWLEIADALNENCGLVKREWKILRDSYRQAINRKKVVKKGFKPKRWRYEKKMSYLLPYMTRRQSSGDKQPYVDPMPHEIFDTASEESIEETLDVPLDAEDPVKTEDKTYWAQSESVPSSSFTNSSDKNDDLELFFKSLLCTARKLPKSYQNKIKMELLQVVSKIEEEYYSNNDFNCNS